MKRQFKKLGAAIASAIILLWAHTSSAWNWSDQQRGWVDVVEWHVGLLPGPLPPGRVVLQGWACLSPEISWLYAWGYGSSVNVAVYQGGPPGAGGTPVSVWFANTVNRPDVVAYGACANTDNGFTLGVVQNPNLPAVFYVTYVGWSATITLEGTSTAAIVP